MKKVLMASAIVFASIQGYGGSFTLPQLDPSQTDGIFRTLSSALAFRSVQPASSATLFGFSVGVTGISASTNQVTSLVGTSTPTIYDGDVNASLQVPFGLAVEAGFIPSVSISGINVSRFGINAKWTFTDFFSGLPVNAAVRACYTNASLSYSESLNGGTVNVGYNTNMYGANLMVSKKLAIVEPYVSYGLLQQSSTLSGTGTSNLFNGNFPAGTTNISNSSSSGWLQLGVQVSLGIFSIAGEYDNLYLDDTFAARLALNF